MISPFGLPLDARTRAPMHASAFVTRLGDVLWRNRRNLGVGMNASEPNPSRLASLRAAIAVTDRRARLAMWGIALVGLFKVGVPTAQALIPVSLPFAMRGLALGFAEWPAWITAAILYCRWLYRAYEDNARLGGSPLRFTPSYAVGTFFIPIVNLWQPYQAIRDLYVASDPRSLPDPPQFAPSTDVLYRSSGRELVAPPKWNTRFPVAAWWGLYMFAPAVVSLVFLVVEMAGLSGSGSDRMAAMALSGMGLVTVGIHVVSAALAIQVIRAIKARQGERLRRLEAAEA
jgi:hypothetical protein